MPPNDHDEPEDATAGGGSPLSTDDLDFSKDEHVKMIDDNRYVVSPDTPIDSSTSESSTADEATPDESSPHERLRADLQSSPHAYGIELSAKLEGGTGTHRTRSDDLVTTFESLLLWFTHYVDDETPPAEVLGILLAESNLTVRYPQGTLRSLVDAYDLGSDDSIADLLSAVGEDGVDVSRD